MCVRVCVTAVHVPVTSDDEFYAFYIGLQLYYVYGYSSVGMRKTKRTFSKQ